MARNKRQTNGDIRAASLPELAETKHAQRKEISVPESLIARYTTHRRALKMTEVAYLNNAVRTYFTAVLTQGGPTLGLQVPGEACAACGASPASITKPNAPASTLGRREKRKRLGARFGDAEAKMMIQLSDEWFNGTWSWAMEAAILYFLPRE